MLVSPISILGSKLSQAAGLVLRWSGLGNGLVDAKDSISRCSPWHWRLDSEKARDGIYGVWQHEHQHARLRVSDYTPYICGSGFSIGVLLHSRCISVFMDVGVVERIEYELCLCDGLLQLFDSTLVSIHGFRDASPTGCSVED